MDAQQGNGLTLEALAKILETQTQRLEALERENSELRSKVATLEDSGTPRNEIAEIRGPETRRSGQPVSVLEGQVSRRSLLSKAGAAAVAAVAAGTLLNPREANASDGTFDHIRCWGSISTDSLFAWTNDPNFAVHGENAGSGPAVEGKAAEGPGVTGTSTGGTSTGAGVEGTAYGSLGKGVMGTGAFGVWGESERAGHYGVFGRNTNTDGIGVRGVTNDTNGSAGVKGSGSIGVWGQSSKTGYEGVYGQHTGGTSGHGVVGDGNGSDGIGVLGRNSTGIGVQGKGKNGVYGESATGGGWGAVVGRSTGQGGIGTYGECSGGTGVKGVSTSGYAGVFEGGKAQLKLKPAGSAGAPGGAHAKGEIYMDSAGTLFVCVAGGNPAEWKRLSATAV